MSYIIIKKSGEKLYSLGTETTAINSGDKWCQIAEEHLEIVKAIINNSDLIVYWENKADSMHGWIDREYLFKNYNRENKYIIVLARGHTISLKNTYCTTTIRHTETLEKTFKNVRNNNNNNFFVIEQQPDRVTVTPINYVPNDNYKQVELNSHNEWVCVDTEPSFTITENTCKMEEEITKEVFAGWEFEVPSFECEILTFKNELYVGYIKTFNDELIAGHWTKDGKFISGRANYKDWNLTPLKQLHETIKYPCILVDSDNDELFIVYGYDNDKKEFYNKGGAFLGNEKTYKLASKDETKILIENLELLDGNN